MTKQSYVTIASNSKTFKMRIEDIKRLVKITKQVLPILPRWIHKNRNSSDTDHSANGD